MRARQEEVLASGLVVVEMLNVFASGYFRVVFGSRVLVFVVLCAGGLVRKLIVGGTMVVGVSMNGVFVGRGLIERARVLRSSVGKRCRGLKINEILRLRVLPGAGFFRWLSGGCLPNNVSGGGIGCCRLDGLGFFMCRGGFKQGPGSMGRHGAACRNRCGGATHRAAAFALVGEDVMEAHGLVVAGIPAFGR